MDRSITPRISQLPQSQAAASPHRTPTAKHDALHPDAGADSSDPSKPSPGLLSWMRAALQLGPAGQSASSRPDAAASILPTIVDSPPGSAGGTTSSRASHLRRRTSLQSSLSSRPRSSVSRDSQYSLYDDDDDKSDESADEETFAPFAPAPAAAAAGQPALVRPTARRDAAFVRESSDGSLGEGQVLLDGAPAPSVGLGASAAAPAQRISFGAAASAVAANDGLLVHEGECGVSRAGRRNAIRYSLLIHLLFFSSRLMLHSLTSHDSTLPSCSLHHPQRARMASSYAIQLPRLLLSFCK